MRKILRFLSLSALLSGGLLPLAAGAQDDVRRVVTSSAPITKTLGGGKAGDLILNTKVAVHEERGAWSRVTVDGWVRTSALSPPAVAPGSGADGAAEPENVPAVREDVLSVEDFISTHRTDIDPPRQYLMLTVKNVSSSKISEWSGLLVGQDKTSNKILFREPLSQEQVDIAPGTTSDVSFYWEPHEELYSILGVYDKNSLELNLVKVEAK